MNCSWLSIPHRCVGVIEAAEQPEVEISVGLFLSTEGNGARRPASLAFDPAHALGSEGD